MEHHFKRVAIVETKWTIRQKRIASSSPGEYPFELAEAARYLRLQPSLLRVHMANGAMNGKALPICYQAGRHFYFLRKDLDAFLGVSTPTLATPSRPIKQIIAFLDGLPLTNPQRARLLGVRADTLQKLRDNRQSGSRTAHLSACKTLMEGWPSIGESILARWTAGKDLLQIVQEEVDPNSRYLTTAAG